MLKTLYLDNIKCHGCANSITSKLKDNDFNDVNVNVEEGSVTLNDDADIDKAKSLLKSMGYPERDHSTFGDAARSYVSCMIGRIKK